MGALLASPLGRRLALFGAVAAAFMAMSGWLWIERNWRQAAEARAAAAEAEVEARDRSIAALEVALEEAKRRQARYEPIRRAVNAAPATNACVTSPAIGALLDGLRAAPRGAGSGQPPAMPSPAGR